MVVFLVDDLFFSIKIKTAARLVNAEVYFERTGENTLETIREKQPHLVVFDLDSVKLRPIETVAAMKADPDPAVRCDAGIRVARPCGHDRGGPRRRHRSGAGAVGIRRPAGKHPHRRDAGFQRGSTSLGRCLLAR